MHFSFDSTDVGVRQLPSFFSFSFFSVKDQDKTFSDTCIGDIRPAFVRQFYCPVSTHFYPAKVSVIPQAGTSGGGLLAA